MSVIPDFISFACLVMAPMSAETFRKAKLNLTLHPNEVQELDDATRRILLTSEFHLPGKDFEETRSAFRNAVSYNGDIYCPSDKLILLSLAALHCETWQRYVIQSLLAALPSSISSLPELTVSKTSFHTSSEDKSERGSSSSCGSGSKRGPNAYTETAYRVGRIHHDLRYLQR
jgi:hypothetical protein